jgi:hypothetical protein
MNDPLGGGQFIRTIIVVGLIIVEGMLMSPTVNDLFRSVDTSGDIPLIAAAIRFAPYGFLCFIAYFALTLWKTGGK